MGTIPKPALDDWFRLVDEPTASVVTDFTRRGCRVSSSTAGHRRPVVEYLQHPNLNENEE